MPILYEPAQDEAARIVSSLPETRHVSTMGELDALVSSDQTELLVVFGPGADLGHALRFAAEQRIMRPTLGLILLRREFDTATLSDALRAGVREVVATADTDAVREACERSVQLSQQMAGVPAPAAAPPSRGRVITVFAGKGGCGKSTIAINLGVALAAGGTRRVCLIDLDLAFGDMAIMLQLIPNRSIADAVEMTGELDETGLRGLLTPYGPGVETLLAPAGPTEGERVSGDLVRSILRVAQTTFDYIIIDTPPLFTDQALAALDASDQYVVPATPDIPTLKNVRLTLDTFDDLGYPPEQRAVVLNRVDSRVGLTAADIERVIKTPIAAHVPASRDVPISINRGVPIMLDNPGHQVSRAISQLAELCADRDKQAARDGDKALVAAAAGKHRQRRRGLLSWRGR